jgi:excisionase family DNA binding protein
MPGSTHTIHEPLVTAREVAELLGVTTSWVYEQSRRGRIPTVTLGRYRRYRLQAIEAWVEGLEAPDHHGVIARSPLRGGDGRRAQRAEYSRGGHR